MRVNLDGAPGVSCLLCSTGAAIAITPFDDPNARDEAIRQLRPDNRRGLAVHYNTQAPVRPSDGIIHRLGNAVHEEMNRQMTPATLADAFAPLANACHAPGILHDFWRSKFRWRKRPNPKQANRLLFRVLQGKHEDTVSPARPDSDLRVCNSQPLVDTVSHLSMFHEDFITLLCVDRELGERILSALQPLIVRQTPEAKDVIRTVIDVLAQLTTQDTLDLGSANWEAVQQVILKYLSKTLANVSPYQSHHYDITATERMQSVTNSLFWVGLDISEDAFVEQLETEFGTNIDSLKDAIFNQFVVGLKTTPSPATGVNMATWTSHIDEEFRVLNTIRDGRQFPSLDTAVAAFLTPQNDGGYSEKYRKLHNLTIVARLPFYVVWLLGYNAFIDLMDMAIGSPLEPIACDLVPRPNETERWVPPFLDSNPVCPICQEGLSQQDREALDTLAVQFQRASGDLTSADLVFDADTSGVDVNCCGHFCHKSCIDSWLSPSDRTCPTCRVGWLGLPEK
ncbi:MAG: hypothetical protein KVP17_001936 [Porospora cf. gigantea B]|uniref:uncharacterized protein n=1 Tax=Porospora cf. gigantea B TaxID=2853592 RepID=UPI0035718450|nr:MAG: hypothetical protein KVP17_001936 [Porospora cf. gigantea B]